MSKQKQEDQQKKEFENNLANVQEQASDKPIDMGGYGTSKEPVKSLSQDQMLGTGGGRVFMEIDDNGLKIEHMAMPCSLRERKELVVLIRRYYSLMQQRAKLFEPDKKELTEAQAEKKAKDIVGRHEKLENDAFETQLEIAYYCFKKADATVRGKSIEDGKAALAEWMTADDLKEILVLATELNQIIPFVEMMAARTQK